MVKRLLFAILILAGFSLQAQNGTVSPYSAFGIGDLRSVRSVENQMMGGLGMYTDSIHLHLSNPAALGKLGVTTYAAGASHRELRLETFSDKQNSSVTNLDYLALALPLKIQKAGLAFGLKPFSSVGYNLTNTGIGAGGAEVSTTYSGEGGVNQVFISLGFEVLPRVHIGATVNHFFGRLEYGRSQITDGVAYGTLDQRISDIRGYDFNYALTYTPMVSSKHTLFTSLRIRTQSNLTSENQQTISTFVPLTGVDIFVRDINLDEDLLRFTEIKIPTTFTLGLGFGEDKHWFLGAEYSLQQFSDFQNRFLELDGARYEDVASYAVGGYYIPDYTAIDSYFRRVAYRAGMRVEPSGFVVNDKSLTDFGITFGMGLPLGGDFSNLNLGFELGRRGTTMNSLVRESYFNLSLGLSFNSRWFQKRTIN
ncbi:hypothetical protein OZ410_06040 [Robiginitalea sp. M366]|uniref:hypothetical protein n=1 Tax=Robiginitalea aestuariiviva TaxID=3036903 RepID=UPI00240E389C|nr:hypothetical protein [Robiginitalea aestuariiviva]MDG1571868.1 hypothetical protein [Robiginitalea aestuariiviva]